MDHRAERRRLFTPDDDDRSRGHPGRARLPRTRSHRAAVDGPDVHVRARKLPAHLFQHVRAVAVRPPRRARVESAELRALLCVVRIGRVAAPPHDDPRRDAHWRVGRGVRRDARVRDALAGRRGAVLPDSGEGEVAGGWPCRVRSPARTGCRGRSIERRVLRAPRRLRLRLALSALDFRRCEPRASARAHVTPSRRSG
jgi:hypothetical protein